MKPRPYQIEAKRSVYAAFKRGARSALVVAATGLGKGAVIGMMVADAIAVGKRVLVFVHRKEIVDQLAGHVRTWAGVDPAIEQGDRAEATDDSQVVVASVLSIVRRFDRFPADRFDLLIYDEAHHATSTTPIAVFNHFGSARLVGLTATPNRGDERALGQVFDEVVFEMPIDVAIRSGWLVPLRVVRVNLPSLDLSDVRRRHGDLVAGDLGAVMSTVAVMREAVRHALDHAADRKALVFCCTVAHMRATATAIRLAAEERRCSLVVETVDGGTPKAQRDQIFADFRAGRIQWLVGVDVFGEGVDVPGVDAVIRFRPTQSRVVYVQHIGRGARPMPGVVDGVTAETMLVEVDHAMATGRLPADPPVWIASALAELHRGSDDAARRLAIAMSDKPECLVLDFTDSADRFDLATALDALGGDYSLPEQREAERILASGDAANLLDALEQARAAAAAKMRAAQARAGDPFALFNIPCRRDRYGRPPTPKHRKILDPLALPLGDVDWRMANDLCAELARRDSLDLCLYQQARVLARLGCPPDWVPEMKRAEASRLVEAVAQAHWRRPGDWPGIRREVAASGEQ